MDKADVIVQVGLLIDKCDNYLAATVLKVRPEIHVEGLKGGIEEVRAMLQELYVALGDWPAQ